MGTYCELYIANYPVFSSKSYVSPIVMTLFRETDKRIFDRKCVERNRIEWGHIDWNPQEVETVVEYSTTVAQVRDRLRVMGFTLARAKADFAMAKQSYLARVRERALFMRDTSLPHLYDDTITLFSSSSFDDFLHAYSEVLSSVALPSRFAENVPEASELARHLLGRSGDHYWGFPCSDIRFFFRALLEVVSDNALVTQDITDLVNSGYYNEDDAVCDLAQQELNGEYPVSSRIIVLAEGPTDSQVLQVSLDLLYPHLSDYYSFMDLAARAPGGAGSLVNVVKAFSGAGIENRTIALFDNDAAGHSAVSLLQGVRLASNIRVMNYPDIALATTYPTVGPNGMAIQDVNGSACSIEMYFGRDVLAVGGRLTPVRWKSLDERIGRYQGEIENKDGLKKRFLQKVDVARLAVEAPPPGDWDEMKALLNTIFDAFAS